MWQKVDVFLVYWNNFFFSQHDEIKLYIWWFIALQETQFRFTTQSVVFYFYFVNFVFLSRWALAIKWLYAPVTSNLVGLVSRHTLINNQIRRWLIKNWKNKIPRLLERWTKSLLTITYAWSNFYTKTLQAELPKYSVCRAFRQIITSNSVYIRFTVWGMCLISRIHHQASWTRFTLTVCVHYKK